jgi:hypothetical protein
VAICTNLTDDRSARGFELSQSARRAVRTRHFVFAPFVCLAFSLTDPNHRIVRHFRSPISRSVPLQVTNRGLTLSTLHSLPPLSLLSLSLSLSIYVDLLFRFVSLGNAFSSLYNPLSTRSSTIPIATLLIDRVSLSTEESFVGSCLPSGLHSVTFA